MLGGCVFNIIVRYRSSPLYGGGRWRRQRQCHGAVPVLCVVFTAVWESYDVSFGLSRFLRCSVSKFSGTGRYVGR